MYMYLSDKCEFLCHVIDTLLCSGKAKEKKLFSTRPNVATNINDLTLKLSNTSDITSDEILNHGSYRQPQFGAKFVVCPIEIELILYENMCRSIQ